MDDSPGRRAQRNARRPVGGGCRVRARSPREARLGRGRHGERSRPGQTSPDRIGPWGSRQARAEGGQFGPAARPAGGRGGSSRGFRNEVVWDGGDGRTSTGAGGAGGGPTKQLGELRVAPPVLEGGPGNRLQPPARAEGGRTRLARLDKARLEGGRGGGGEAVGPAPRAARARLSPGWGLCGLAWCGLSAGASARGPRGPAG